MSEAVAAAHIEPCTSKCRGQSCCDCCGKAPAMHRCGDRLFSFQRYDNECCIRCRVSGPKQCMWLQGKTRAEWSKEMLENENPN